MKKAVLSLVLCMALCCSFVLPAAAVSDALPGWELWQAENGNGHVALTCPALNADTHIILSAVAKLIAEHQAERRVFTVIFRYSRADISFSALVNRMLTDISDAISGIWPCGEQYACIGISAERTPAYDYRLNVRVETGGAYDPDGRLAAAYHEVVEIAKAAEAAGGPYEQLSFINRELADRITYDAAATPYSLDEAMLDGRAACTGYTAAVSLICRYLGIPCVTIRNSSHAWNSVFVDGRWKHLDATWNDDGNDEYLLLDYLGDATGSHSYDADVLTSTHVLQRQRMAYYNLPARFSAARDYLSGKEIMEDGMSGAVTRGELAGILTRLDGAEPAQQSGIGIYSDVPDELADCVGYCNAAGLMMGCGAGLFRPNAPVTPEAACTVALRLLDIGGENTDWSYAAACKKAVSEGLVPEHFFTGTVITRAQLAYLLHVAVTF